ncbi:dioxygenase family protein [Abyssalbus ytuae]|uniref:Intradiol ring-cleavage dioxygenase n=1 Tax=Abyssalbus ytuae TaxID=2926907 RepID=A0A9E7A2S6_9FLAO|nr:intradiol ring-cleavage dioxygenase [Abyssalbus ytuae]UOB18771.1 intradiol ring-cleavage dioxygenase [Abyssalbus ytuae]
MKRKDFLKKGIVGIGTIVALPTVVNACSKSDDNNSQNGDTGENSNGECSLSPQETKGPFPIHTPAELVKANIVSDRSGVALLINITVQDLSENCEAASGVYVDIWHCDSDGNYSEYGGTSMQSTDYTDVSFLRGRQLTDVNGQVSFISIYPGWYMGRAPHIHVEILDKNENSLLVTQIAFPENISEDVYVTENYHGSADTSNNGDNVFSDSLDENMADSVTGNNTDGYTLNKTIIIS